MFMLELQCFLLTGTKVKCINDVLFFTLYFSARLCFVPVSGHHIQVPDIRLCSFSKCMMFQYLFPMQKVTMLCWPTMKCPNASVHFRGRIQEARPSRHQRRTASGGTVHRFLWLARICLVHTCIFWSPAHHYICHVTWKQCYICSCADYNVCTALAFVGPM